MKNSIFVSICGLMMAIFLPLNGHAADLEEGKAAFETCRGCHSTPNYSNVYPTYYVPKIGGQRAEYVAAALQAYKEQSRPHGTMKANSYDLSEEKIENIAAYIEKSVGKKTVAHGSGDPSNGKTLTQSCLGCHTSKLDDGATAPILAGQHGNYLVKAMQDYQSGKRNNPIMQSMLNNLSDEELKDIAAYFARLKGLGVVE